MHANAKLILGLALLPGSVGCGQGKTPPEKGQQSAQVQDQGPASASQDSTQNAQRAAVDSQAISFMPMMWMHLDSMARWSPPQMQQMMTVHQQMAGRMLQMMGPTGMMGHGMMGPGMGPGMMGDSTWMGPGSPWTTLRDSIQNDLSTMPGLSGKDLAALSQAHIDRMRRMMVLGMGMMPGGGWATMPGGCGMIDSAGQLSAQRRQQMWTMHSQMSSQMMTAMMANMRARGVTPSPQWMALRDSVTHDMADLPKLQGDTLRSRMQAHMDRMHRLMGVQAQAMGMPMGPMGMGCSW